MTDRITLTEDEMEQILDAIWTKRDDGPHGYPVMRWGIEFPVVESIVASRVRAAKAEALREAAKELHSTNALAYPEWLAARANEYDPQEGSE